MLGYDGEIDVWARRTGPVNDTRVTTTTIGYSEGALDPSVVPTGGALSSTTQHFPIRWIGSSVSVSYHHVPHASTCRPKEDEVDTVEDGVCEGICRGPVPGRDGRGWG